MEAGNYAFTTGETRALKLPCSTVPIDEAGVVVDHAVRAIDLATRTQRILGPMSGRNPVMAETIEIAHRHAEVARGVLQAMVPDSPATLFETGQQTS